MIIDLCYYKFNSEKKIWSIALREVGILRGFGLFLVRFSHS